MLSGEGEKDNFNITITKLAVVHGVILGRQQRMPKLLSLRQSPLLEKIHTNQGFDDQLDVNLYFTVIIKKIFKAKDKLRHRKL